MGSTCEVGKVSGMERSVVYFCIAEALDRWSLLVFKASQRRERISYRLMKYIVLPYDIFTLLAYRAPPCALRRSTHVEVPIEVHILVVEIQLKTLW